MGYSHSYGFIEEKTEFSEEEIRIVKEIAEEYKDIIRFEIGVDKPPEINNKLIRLNGIGNQACETFILKPNTKSDFCKTGQYEYDLPVCAILLVIKHFNRNSFRVESDGFWVSKSEVEEYRRSGLVKLDGNWNEALENLNKKYQMEFLFSLKETGNDIKYYHFELK